MIAVGSRWRRADAAATQHVNVQYSLRRRSRSHAGEIQNPSISIRLSEAISVSHLIAFERFALC